MRGTFSTVHFGGMWRCSAAYEEEDSPIPASAPDEMVGFLVEEGGYGIERWKKAAVK